MVAPHGVPPQQRMPCSEHMGGLCNHPRFTLPTHMLLLAAAGAGPCAAWQLGGRDSWVVQAQWMEQPDREKRREGGEEQGRGRGSECERGRQMDGRSRPGMAEHSHSRTHTCAQGTECTGTTT